MVSRFKPALFIASSRRDLQRCPEDVRRAAGRQITLVQQGLDPTDWKPMPSVGPGVREIRIHTGVEHRVIYVAKFEEAVYVLHVFEKRTRKTPVADINLAKARMALLM